MAEYGGDVLWWAGKRAGPIAVNELGLSTSLIERLRAWSEQYDGTLNAESPTESGFPSEDEEAAFEKIGRQLWRSLKEELPSFDVVFFNTRTQQVEE